MTNRRDLARAMFSKLLAGRVRDVRLQHGQDHREDLITLFRSCAVGLHLTGSQAASARQLIADFPAEWAEAQRLGPLGTVPRYACNGTQLPADPPSEPSPQRPPDLN